jgi:hypothetical protein
MQKNTSSISKEKHLCRTARELFAWIPQQVLPICLGRTQVRETVLAARKLA